MLTQARPGGIVQLGGWGGLIPDMAASFEKICWEAVSKDWPPSPNTYLLDIFRSKLKLHYNHINFHKIGWWTTLEFRLKAARCLPEKATFYWSPLLFIWNWKSGTTKDIKDIHFWVAYKKGSHTFSFTGGNTCSLYPLFKKRQRDAARVPTHFVLFLSRDEKILSFHSARGNILVPEKIILGNPLCPDWERHVESPKLRQPVELALEFVRPPKEIIGRVFLSQPSQVSSLRGGVARGHTKALRSEMPWDTLRAISGTFLKTQIRLLF